jgi:hypothetical protein
MAWLLSVIPVLFLILQGIAYASGISLYCMLLFVHVPEQKQDVPAAPNSLFFFSSSSDLNQ